MTYNKNLLIAGAGQYGQVAKEIAVSMGCFEKIAFLDDGYNEEDAKDTSMVGKLYNYESFVAEYSYAVVAIGCPELRLEYIRKMQDKHFKIATLVSPQAYISPSAQIMCGSIVEAAAVINSNVNIAIGVYVCAGAIVNHNSFIGDGCTLQCGSVVPASSLVLAKTVLGYNEVYAKNRLSDTSLACNDYKF